jgi:HEAT repeat protein
MPLIRKDQTSAAGPAGQPDPAALLTSGAPDDRWSAARALGDAPGGIGILSEALAGEQDPRVREAIFTSLARQQTLQAAEALLPSLRSDDASLRTGALDALRNMPVAVAALLPALLRDPDPDVRLLVTELARGLPAMDAGPVLCGLLESEVEVNVCAAIVDVLAEIGGPEVLPVLHRLAVRFSAEPFLGFAIKVATQRIGAPPRG